MLLTDAIVAVSSSGGSGGTRGIVRISGRSAWQLARTIVDVPERPGWHARLPLKDLPAPVANVLLFKAPRSFTGEDIAELQLPNSPALLRGCVDKILQHPNVRLANPGEFSARAFFNGKLDLTEAEGIAATINAGSDLELRAAASLRSGDLHQNVQRWTNRLADALALVEAGIDFAEEEHVSFINGESLFNDLCQISSGLHQLTSYAVRVDRLDRIPTVVFVGQPNVGKSSLVNALAGENRSITSEVAGTTRDMLSVVMQTGAGPVRLIDVPGEEQAADELRIKMMEARANALAEADLVVDVVAHDKEIISSLAESGAYVAEYLCVQNKVDLLAPAAVRTFEFLEDSAEFMTFREPCQMVSARTGMNVERLREYVGKRTYRKGFIAHHFPALNQRHRLLLQQTRNSIEDAIASINAETMAFSHPELLAADLRRALDLLGEITGAVSPDEILGKIFSTFCIGK